MDPTFVSENLASWAVQTSAADMKQQQEANRMAESETVQELKDALHFATQELKTAKEENAYLKEKIAVLEDAHKMEVSRLQEELKLKDEALQRCVKKRRARTKAWVELLHESTIKDMEINTREQHWSSKWQSTEKSLKEEKKKVEELQIKNKLLFEKLQENLDKWKNVLQELAPNADHQEETLETNSHEEKLENHEGEEEGTDKPRKDKKKQEEKEEKQETEEEIEGNLERKSDEKMEDKTATEDLNPNLCLVPIPLTPSNSCPLPPVPTPQLNPSASSLPYPLSRALSYSSPSSYSLRHTLSLHTFPQSSSQPYSVSRAPSYYLPLFSKPVQPLNSNEIFDLLFCSF
ncbi:eukaryotic translation initiation factor 5B-like [Oreochromis niloticus]|uniref:eukaryotic translation initiation factor 5B-like n=1 Tax=Oreochromis niloticus TaxID=8128 RepID=UPI0009049EF9|nr:eukaryotic translation initiation factor 5B-like [Oreochromis niloticus]